MKRILTLLISISACASLTAAPVDVAALKTYATNALPRCTESKVSLERQDEPAPTGFVKFKLLQTSTDPTCGKNTTLLFSPSTSQILMGTIVPLPYDSRPIDVRVSQAVSERLNVPVNAVMTKTFPLPDALKPVTMTKGTARGPFAYHGYVDASEQFLVVGSRGNLKTDPGITLVDALNLPANAVRRGNPKAKTQIIEISDFECPSCGRSHKVIEPIVAKHLQNVDYYRLDLPLFEMHPWALDAAAGARAINKIAPKKYWDYTNYIYANQETIGEKVPFEQLFKNWVEDNDISWPAVEKVYRDPALRAALVDQVSRILDLGVNSTPTYIINGRIMGYGPEGKNTLDEVKKALGVK
jgi:protein-disulfide isomerase